MIRPHRVVLLAFLILSNLHSTTTLAAKHHVTFSYEAQDYLNHGIENRLSFWRDLLRNSTPTLYTFFNRILQVTPSTFDAGIYPERISVSSSQIDAGLLLSPASHTKIDYISLVSESVYNRTIQPRGIIIRSYGIYMGQWVSSSHVLAEDRIYASQGYIVYVLNWHDLRTWWHKKDDFIRNNSDSDVNHPKSLVKAITYFATLLRTGNIDSNGKGIQHAELMMGEFPVPIFFTGFSYGGYLALMLSTSNGDFINSTPLSPNTAFDGYIPVAGISDWEEDFRASPSGRVRKTLFTENNVCEAHSPVCRVSQLRRPVLLMHGLGDTNASYTNASLFFNKAQNEGKGYLIAQYYQGNIGHEFPNGAEKIRKYYEAQFRFMDFVRFEKRHTRQDSAELPIESQESNLRITQEALAAAVGKDTVLSTDFLTAEIEGLE